ncbi:MAG: twitching motility protein PilT [Acidimicrobiales bacterium]
MGVTYDAGALVAADRGERRMWARHRVLLQLRQVPIVPAPVVAQAWRGGRRQARLSRLLVGCNVERLDDGQARRVGELLARAALSDIVDATVVEGSLRRGDLVISSDPMDLSSLASAIHRHLEVDRP